MIKKLLKKLFYNKYTAKYLLKFVLKLHSKAYAWSGQFAIIVDDGIHPKHRIMRYKEWFLDNISPDWVVVDVGCNTGMMVEVMSLKAEFVYGIEIEQSHINIAKENIKKENIEFVCADATTFDYSLFIPIDCITLSNVLEHIENRVEFLQKLISQVKWRDTKSFIIRVPMIDREWIAIYKKELGLEYRLDDTHFIEYTFDIFRKELLEANIQIKSHHIKFGEIYAVCEVK